MEQLGGMPTLIDVQPNSTKIQIEQLELAKTDRTRAVVVSHLHGEAQDIDQIRTWADEQNVILIEDACQALGGQLNGRPVGSFGHMTLLSFGGSKVVSAGRGGALVTSDDSFFQKAKIASGAGSGAYSLSELAASIILAQFAWLPEINRTVSEYFAEVERTLPTTLRRSFLGAVDKSNGAYYQAGWLLEDPGLTQSIIECLGKKQLPVGAGFSGFHRRSARRCNIVAPLTNTTNLVDRLITVHHSLALDEQTLASEFAAEIVSAMHGGTSV